MERIDVVLEKLEFQSLIGRLQTARVPVGNVAADKFQSLIGRLQTRVILLPLIAPRSAVSIPHR